MLVVAVLSTFVASSSCAGVGLFLVADAGAGGADLHRRVPLDRSDRRRGRLSGLTRGGNIGPFNLDNGFTFYVAVALIGLVVLYVLLRVVRSPFGHVLVAIRENQLRATFQGYSVERYKLGVFVISAVVTGLAGALLGFQTYLVSAEAVSVPFPASCWRWS